VLERQIPDREGFKLGVAGFDASFVVVIKLRQARGQFSAARPRSCDDYQRFVRGDIIIHAVALVADD